MLQGPRMQSFYGSTEAINVNGTEICPLTTWDSKITSVLAMLGGVGGLTGDKLKQEKDIPSPPSSSSEQRVFKNLYERFVYVVNREYEMVFGTVDDVLVGEGVDVFLPANTIPNTELSDWVLSC
jgi:hypothetical protein